MAVQLRSKMRAQQYTPNQIIEMLKDYEPPFDYLKKHEPTTSLLVEQREAIYIMAIDLKPGHDLSELNRLGGVEYYEDLVENFKSHGYENGMKRLIYNVQVENIGDRVVFEVIETLPQ